MRPSRKPLLVLFIVGMALAVPALAQQPSSGYPAPCDAAKISKTESDRAHTVFLSGKGFLDEASYDKAISYFKDAYTIDCSVHGILPIIATAYERKGDKGEAVNALEEYLWRVPAAADRDVIERRIRNLKEQIAQAAASASASSSAPVAATPTATAAPIGSTAATVTAPEPPATATGGPPLPPPSQEYAATPWLLVGAGAVVLAAGVVLYVVGNGDVSSASQTCPNHTACTSASATSTGNTGRTLEGVGVGVGIAGILGVVGGILWRVVEKPQPVGAVGLRVTPAVAPGYAGVGLGGSF